MTLLPNLFRILVILCCLVSAFAQAAQQKRVALVVGNAAYKSAPLANPVNDARAIAARLATLGFEVIKRENLSTKQIGPTLREFRSRLAPGAEALFFYAGHGLQVKGVNYLPAIDADISAEEEVPNQSINVNNVLEIMEDSKTRLNLVFLDACRNNPYSRRFRSVADGLAKVNAPSGTILSFATRPGSVAADGDGKNGLYTEHLLLAMEEKGLPIEQVLKKVLTGVKKASKGKQEPWIEGGIEGEFYFIQGTVNITGTPPASAPVDPLAVEMALWDSIKASQNREDFEEYLRQYPKGKFAVVARNRIKTLSAPRLEVDHRAEGGVPTTSPGGSALSGAPIQPGQTFKDCVACPEMVIIPAGSFQMGANNGDSDEKPVHTVTISRPFALGKTEVTQGQWKAIMLNKTGQTSNPSSFRHCGDDCPVERVSWSDAIEFIARLNAKTGESYRLPSEAEWEYACRSGSNYKHCGDNNIDAVAWIKLNSDKKTQVVASKQANGFGLYDMSGNVWEWTEDCYHDHFNGAPTDGSSWTSGECKYRVLRGGGLG